MADDPADLVPVFLRRLDVKMDAVLDLVREHGYRLTTLEAQVGSLAATTASQYANLNMRLDRLENRLENRLDRIERRLDLVDAAG
jgi:tetrahydromethanopterin S-methyltransferase subunit G